MVYDHLVGDEIQYLDQYYCLDGPPWFNYKNYIKYIFLDRSDTQDSIIYTVERLTYKTDSNLLIQDTINLKYNRNNVIAESPFDKLDQDNTLVLTNFYKADYCGFSLWTYSRDAKYKIYCPADNCWGNYDIPGPPPDQEKILVCGLGLYLDKDALSAPPPQGYYHIYNIIYFKKDGIECGEEIIVDLEEPLIPVSRFIIYPNPAKENLFVKTNGNAEGSIILNDIHGQLIKKVAIQGHLTSIETGGLTSGIYLVKIIADSSVEVKKIIIEAE